MTLQEKMMSFRNRFVVTTITVILFGLTPCLSHSQSLGDLLKLVPKSASVNTNNIFDTIKSLSEMSIGQVEPGTNPENADGKVILYRTASCPFCKRAATAMRQSNVSFVERDIEKNSNWKSEFNRLGGRGVPFIVLGEKTMSGFDEAKFEQYYTDFKNSLASQANSSASGSPTSNKSLNNIIFQSGDVLTGKISGVNIYLQPTKSEKLTVLSKSDEMIYMGEARDGFYRVTTQKGEGWVDKLLVKKQ